MLINAVLSSTMQRFSAMRFPVSNILLITDVARLRKLFGNLTEDKNIRLRVVNNLEKGGEEIVIEKPDIVFVQTHLSGLSPDILLMHLKKQLGRKRSRFVLLASPGQINPDIIKPYQGWLDSSLDDTLLLSELDQLVASLLGKVKKREEISPLVDLKDENITPQLTITSDSPDLTTIAPVSKDAPELDISPDDQLPAILPTPNEPSLEEQGITYPPRQRLKVYSDFNISFDSAVTTTKEPETLEQAAPHHSEDWNSEEIDTAAVKYVRSKKGMFLLWLAPVVVAVIVLTYFQQKNPTEPTTSKISLAVKAVVPPTPPPSPAAGQIKEVVKPDQKESTLSRPDPLPLTALPKFIPAAGLVKKYSVDNPGWEQYLGGEIEFRLLKKDKTIKVIQVIDKGLAGLSEQFVQRIFQEVTGNKTSLSALNSEKKEGYEIQRGSIAKNIRLVYYRDEKGGKLRAFVLTWQ